MKQKRKIGLLSLFLVLSMFVFTERMQNFHRLSILTKMVRLPALMSQS